MEEPRGILFFGEAQEVPRQPWQDLKTSKSSMSLTKPPSVWGSKNVPIKNVYIAFKRNFALLRAFELQRFALAFPTKMNKKRW